MRRLRGFTLIELLVVMLIIGVVTGAVTLAVGGSAERTLELAAQRAQARIALACERAVVGGHDLGIAVTEDGLRFGYIGAEGWLPFAEGEGEELRERPLGDGLVLHLLRDGERLPPADGIEPQLACFSSGELTPFELRLARAESPRHWRLRGQLDGKLQLEAVDEALR